VNYADNQPPTQHSTSRRDQAIDFALISLYAAEPVHEERSDLRRCYAIVVLVQLIAVAACNGDSATTGPARAGCSPIGTATSNAFVGEIFSECATRAVATDQGRVPCRVLEATLGTCDCSAAIGREATDASLADAVRRQLLADDRCGSTSGPPCEEVCIREIVQLSGEDLATCQNDAGAVGPPGFCYVDPAAGLGDPAVVAECPPASQRKLRVLGDSGAGESWRFAACVGAPVVEAGSP
jgi:hypothetical protein